LPPLLTQSVDLGFRTLPAQRLLVIFAGLLVALAAALTVTRTRFGIWLRAAVDHPDTASTLGIPIRRVQCVSFAAGAALAGFGGILGAELMPLEPYYALKYLVLVLVVVAVGGMGNIAGSLVAAMLLGTVETASKYLASDWGGLFFFLAMALLLAWRPQGLLKR
jgi:branched-chain amino acid transport system permease protein